MVAGRGLAGEDLHPRDAVRRRVVADVLVQRHGVQQVEQLALVLVDALDLHVEQRVRVERHAELLLHQRRQAHLVVPPLLGEQPAQVAGLDVRLQFAEGGFRAVEDAVAEGFAQQAGQLGVGLEQPAAEGHAVGLVADPRRIQAVQVAEHRLAHQLGVQRRHAVHRMRAEERQRAHAHAPAVVLLDQRHRAQQAEVVDVLGAQRVDVVGVDQVDDLHVPRQQALHQRHRPAFQRLGEQRVVGVGQGRHGQRPGRVPFHAVDVHQQAHQLGHGDRRVGVVELDRHPLRQAVQRMAAQVALQQVLQRGGDEEVFLAQAQFLAGFGAVGRIEHPRDAFRAHGVGHRAQVVAGVEAVQLEDVLGARPPQAQGVDAGAAPADHRHVVGDRPHPLVRLPDLAGRATLLRHALHAAAEADAEAEFRPLEFPGIAEVQPGLGVLLLPAVADHLLEQAVLVADAVAVGGDVQGRHAFHEARRQPAEAAVAQRRVRLGQAHALQVHAQFGQRRAGDFQQAEVAQVVDQQAADEEFQREVVDPLALAAVDRPGRFLPAVDQVLAGRQGDGLEPVMVEGIRRVLAYRIAQARQYRMLECFDFRSVGNAHLGHRYLLFARVLRVCLPRAPRVQSFPVARVPFIRIAEPRGWPRLSRRRPASGLRPEENSHATWEQRQIHRQAEAQGRAHRGQLRKPWRAQGRGGSPRLGDGQQAVRWRRTERRLGTDEKPGSQEGGAQVFGPTRRGDQTGNAAPRPYAGVDEQAGAAGTGAPEAYRRPLDHAQA
ncbi:hypothetical protein D9M71_144520 [compost metagenome]